jgi:hypothetical protein
MYDIAVPITTGLCDFKVNKQGEKTALSVVIPTLQNSG